jgi:hypothetical protein
VFTDKIVGIGEKIKLNVYVNVNAPNLPTIQLFASNPRFISTKYRFKIKAMIRPNDSNLKVELIIIETSSNSNFYYFKTYRF